MTANQTTLNDTEVEQDLGEREEKMKEVEAMLREMRDRNSSTQKSLAEREKAEADKRKDTTASTVWLCFPLMIHEDPPAAAIHSFSLSFSRCVSLSLSFFLSHSYSLCLSPPSSTVLQRVNEQLASREQQNNASAQRVRERLGLLHQQMMDLRDALNQAVNNTARAAEVNHVSQETLEDAKVRR